LPSQTAHRAAVPHLGLPEQFGIAASSWYYRRSSSIILLPPSHFTSCAFFQLMQPKTTAITGSIERGYSSGIQSSHGTIRRFMAPESRPFLDPKLQLARRCRRSSGLDACNCWGRRIFPLQANNISRDGGTLLGQWKGEKEGRSFGAGPVNAAATLLASSRMTVSP
jgi:hypothetical protein